MEELIKLIKKYRKIHPEKGVRLYNAGAIVLFNSDNSGTPQQFNSVEEATSYFKAELEKPAPKIEKKPEPVIVEAPKEEEEPKKVKRRKWDAKLF